LVYLLPHEDCMDEPTDPNRLTCYREYLIAAQYLTKPTKSDLAALQRCLLYLRGAYDDVLFYPDERVGEMIVEVDDDVPIHDSNDFGLFLGRLFGYELCE
jgi:hypothetical protein